MPETTTITGGCLCGAVRYEAREAPLRTQYCHCRMCQKAVGNVFALFADFRAEAFRFTQGAPKIYASSSFAERGFCPACGTPLSFRFLDAEHIAISVGSLDRPQDLPAPSGHVGVESWVPWFRLDDGLPHTRTEDDPEFAARKAAFEGR